MKRVAITTACLFFSVLILRGTIEGQVVRSPDESDVDGLFQRFDGGPGCALGVIHEGELVFSRGYGYANLDYDIPIRPKTIFDIGSTSKQFTAAAIVLLAQRGKLSLDQDVRDIIPELPDYGEPITIRMLIHHTSGVRDYLTLMSLAGLSFENVFQEDDGLELLARQRELNFPPNTEYLYSNSGYLLLAVVIRRVSGLSIGEFLASEVFEPLGMKNTFVYEDRFQVVKNRATGYAPDGDGSFVIDHYFNFELGGDGQVYTNVEDLLLWDRNFYDPVVGGPDFLEQMHGRGVLANGDTLDYAFGLEIGEYKGLPVVSHGGAWGGFRSHLLRFPQQKFSVVCLCNVANANPGRLTRQVADLYLADRLTPDVAASTGSVSEPHVEVPDDELERYDGYYWNAAAGTSRRILVRGGRLVYQRGPGNETELVSQGGGRFVMMRDDARVEVKFDPVGGEARRMVLVVDGGYPSVYEAYKPVVVDPTELEEYAGDYRCVELDARYSVTLFEGRLVVRAMNHTEAILQPIVSDLFSVPGLGLTLQFDRDRKGAIVGFELDAGRVKNLWFERV
ncbi:MAG: serine hydrolase domain-containing protein [Gemmatimonadales bacterium]|jgi:CubicO group peptidase (beta-lactamase class C family)